jgi:porin
MFQFRISHVFLCASLLGAVPVWGQSGTYPASSNANDVSAPQTGAQEAFRARMADEKGVAFSLGYNAETLANVSGGIRTGVIAEGLLKVELDIDLSKFVGWTGGSFAVNMLYPHGDGLTQKYVGDLNTLSNIDAYDSLRLFELWLQQSFLDRFSLRVGQLTADREFFISDYGSLFMNSAFGAIPIASRNIPVPIYDVAAPGVRLRYDAKTGSYLEAAVFAGNPGLDTENKYGTDFRLNSSDGALLFLEGGYKINASDGAKGPPGTYKLGAFYHTGEFLDNKSGQMHSGDFAAYFIVDQTVYRETKDPNQGLSLFCRISGAPPGRNFLKLYGDAGFNYTGLIPGRSKDIFGVGTSYAKISNSYRDPITGEGLTGELVIEATYQFVVKSWWNLQPDFQYIVDPGGSSKSTNAVVIGLRSNFLF